MCVIVTIPFDSKVSKSTLEDCFEHNPDGSGISYFDGNKTCVIKGLMTFPDFYKTYQDIRRKNKLSNILLHFRIATHGGYSPYMTHPFPCGEYVTTDDLEMLRYKTDVAIAHNGIIYGYGDKKTLSDTAEFIKLVLSELSRINKFWFKNEVTRSLLRHTIDSKMVIFANNVFYYVGKFEYKDKVAFSNLYHEYKPQKVSLPYVDSRYNDSSMETVNQMTSVNKIEKGLVYWKSGKCTSIQSYESYYILPSYTYASKRNGVVCENDNIIYITTLDGSYIEFDDDDETYCEVQYPLFNLS